MFVGRSPERAWLEGHLRRVAEGHGGTVVVSGPPGVGKTRLVRECLGPARALWARG